jgi:hypothetical protein
METCGIPANHWYGVAVHRSVAKSNTAPAPVTPVTISPWENPYLCYTLIGMVGHYLSEEVLEPFFLPLCMMSGF